MNREENRSYIEKVESLVKPKDVSTISFLGDFNKYLSIKMQHKLMEKGNRDIPYMGFIVDPYCFFLAYEIKNEDAATKMLPNGYELVDTSIFKSDKKRKLVILSAFSARTSAFAGVRLEIYLIARNIESGLVSWIIADYETNTNSHDPKNGFCGYSCDKTVFTTTPYGELIASFNTGKEDREFSIRANLNESKNRELDQELWVEGNLSVDYGGELKDPGSKNFTLIFDPVLMKKAKEIPLNNIIINKNTFLESIIDSYKPVTSAFFPYSQHFVINQRLKKGDIKNTLGLYNQIAIFLERKGFKKMKGEDITKPLFRGVIISSIFNIALIIFLVIKLVF